MDRTPVPRTFESDVFRFTIDKDIINDNSYITIQYEILGEWSKDQKFKTGGAWFGAFPKKCGHGEWRTWSYVNMNIRNVLLHINSLGQRGDWQIRFYKDTGNDNLLGTIDFFVLGESYEIVEVTLDKTEVRDGDMMQVTCKALADYPFNEETGVMYYPRGTRSSCITSNRIVMPNNYPMAIPIVTNGCSGPYEMRFFIDEDSYESRSSIPFTVTSDYAVNMTTNKKRVLDGKSIFVNWDATKHTNLTTHAYIAVYPENETSREVETQKHPVKEMKGSLEIFIESGTRKSGMWEARLFADFPGWVTASVPFFVVGVFEVYANKLMNCNKFIDICIFVEQ
jgi:hypothetical protein